MISRKKVHFLLLHFENFQSFQIKYYSTLDYLSNEVSYANFYKDCLDKFEKVSEVSFILRQILNTICINKQPNDSTIFLYT